MSSDAFILDALRTPIGRGGGVFAQRRSDELAGLLLAELVRRNSVAPAAIEDVILGCVTQTGEQGVNIARNAVLAAGFPVGVPGTSVNRLCASSLQAVATASQAIRAGDSGLLIAGGTESMSRVPMGSDAGAFSPRILDRFDLISQGISAEFIAAKWGLDRRALDEFSYTSHQKALKADFSKEIRDSPWVRLPS